MLKIANLARAALTAAALSFALAACATAPASQVQPDAPFTPATDDFVAAHGRLQVQGTHIVDEHGAPVTLRGMSLFWSQWKPQFYNAGTVRTLADQWGVSAIRAAIAVEPGGYLEHPEREMAKAAAVIDAAIAEGVYVVVDWHAHRPHAKEAGDFFAAIAERYGQYPNLIYETWNEPLDIHDWAQTIKPYHEQVIARIRAVDPDNLIVVGTGTWSQDVDVAAADPIDDPNLAYVLHFYATSHREQLRQKARAALAQGAPLFVSEYGITEYTGDGRIDETEARLWWSFMEENGISYLNWSLEDKDETAAALRPGASGQGDWPDAALTRSGRLVRAQIRSQNGAQEPAP